MTILDEIAAYTRQRMAAEEGQVPTAGLRQQASPWHRRSVRRMGVRSPFGSAPHWQSRAFPFICEVKKASPLEGRYSRRVPVSRYCEELRSGRSGSDFLLNRAKMVHGRRCLLG